MWLTLQEVNFMKPQKSESAAIVCIMRVTVGVSSCAIGWQLGGTHVPFG